MKWLDNRMHTCIRYKPANNKVIKFLVLSNLKPYIYILVYKNTPVKRFLFCQRIVAHSHSLIRISYYMKKVLGKYVLNYLFAIRNFADVFFVCERPQNINRNMEQEWLSLFAIAMIYPIFFRLQINVSRRVSLVSWIDMQHLLLYYIFLIWWNLATTVVVMVVVVWCDKALIYYIYEFVSDAFYREW